MYSLLFYCIIFLYYCRAANHEQNQRNEKEKKKNANRVCFSIGLSLVCSRIAYFSSLRILSTHTHAHAHTISHSPHHRLDFQSSQNIFYILIGNWICFISNSGFVSRYSARAHAIPISRGIDLVSAGRTYSYCSMPYVRHSWNNKWQYFSNRYEAGEEMWTEKCARLTIYFPPSIPNRMRSNSEIEKCRPIYAYLLRAHVEPLREPLPTTPAAAAAAGETK